MFKFKDIVNILGKCWGGKRYKLNKAAEGLTGLKRLLVYNEDIKHAGVYSTLTDIIDTLEDHEKRIKK